MTTELKVEHHVEHISYKDDIKKHDHQTHLCIDKFFQPHCTCDCDPIHICTNAVFSDFKGSCDVYWTIQHNSFDGREGIEAVNDILNCKQ